MCEQRRALPLSAPPQAAVLVVWVTSFNATFAEAKVATVTLTVASLKYAESDRRRAMEPGGRTKRVVKEERILMRSTLDLRNGEVRVARAGARQSPRRVLRRTTTLSSCTKSSEISAMSTARGSCRTT
jgi:hypothetical protein